MSNKKENTIPFGLHVTIDAYNCDSKKLNDQQLVYKILDELPDAIGMHKLMKPYVIFAEANAGWMVRIYYDSGISY